MYIQEPIIIHIRILVGYEPIITVPLCMLSPLGIDKSTILKLFVEELGARVLTSWEIFPLINPGTCPEITGRDNPLVL